MGPPRASRHSRLGCQWFPRKDPRFRAAKRTSEYAGTLQEDLMASVADLALERRFDLAQMLVVLPIQVARRALLTEGELLGGGQIRLICQRNGIHG